jgi:hypothetical protein
LSILRRVWSVAVSEQLGSSSCGNRLDGAYQVNPSILLRIEVINAAASEVFGTTAENHTVGFSPGARSTP